MDRLGRLLAEPVHSIQPGHRGTDNIRFKAMAIHASMPGEVRDQCPIRHNLVRLSVGLENIEDLIEDIARALS